MTPLRCLVLVAALLATVRAAERKPMTPRDGASLPNLILSYRKLLTLGEELRVEMLNVLDTESDATYTVRLSLRGLDGAAVHRFRERTFTMGQLHEVTETIPSETLAAHAALMPALEIRRKDRTRVVDRGWRPIQLWATWNWDYKWAKQPLRDLLPRRGSFRLRLEVKPLTNGLQILFVHRRHYIGSLTLNLDAGKLHGSFTNEQLHTYSFQTDLPVPAGQWSAVEASYDPSSMRLRVNGVEAGPFECRGPGLYNMTGVLGGFGAGKPIDEFADANGWFAGYIAAFAVSHSA